MGIAYQGLFPNMVDIIPGKGLRVPVANVAQSGVLTMGFERPYHIDPRDRNQPTHCSWFPPEFWQSCITQCRTFVGCGFAMGSTIVDLTANPTRITFLPNHVHHCTTCPELVPQTPQFLLGKKSMETIAKKETKEQFYNYARETIVAFGSWSWFRHNRTRAAEYNAVREQANGDRIEQRRLNAELYRRWEGMGFTRETVEQSRARRNRAMVRNRLRRERRMAAHRRHCNGG